MELSQTQFLILNGVIVTIIVASIYFSRKQGAEPVRLKLMEGDPRYPKQKSVPSTEVPFGQNNAPNNKSPEVDRSSLRSSQGGGKSRYDRWVDLDNDPMREARVALSPEEKALNVVFNWNGHSWDAYEVLGIPAGSSIEKVAAAFQEAESKSDPESIAFLQAAYQAILSSR